MMSVKLMQGDCLELMKDIPDGSVDMILADLPYGTTACKWDTIIPFEPLWEQYERVIKDNGAIVLTASQPFTSALVMSNPELFRYEWIWTKSKAGNAFLGNEQPLRFHENVMVFSKAKAHNQAKNKMMYIPQMEERIHLRNNKPKKWTHSGVYGEERAFEATKEWGNTPNMLPKTLIEFSNTFGKEKVSHPTQKPVALFEYLIKTYTNEGDTVLDNVMGSGTTGVACKNLNRNFIGMELDEEYFKIATERINEMGE